MMSFTNGLPSEQRVQDEGCFLQDSTARLDVSYLVKSPDRSDAASSQRADGSCLSAGPSERALSA